MSHTEVLRRTEADLLPPGFVHGYHFVYRSGDREGSIEVDGYNAESREAIEVCQNFGDQNAPKPGHKRKLASDVLKLVFLLSQGLISRGRVYVTSPELYTWFHKANTWLAATCNHFNIAVELHQHERKAVRKQLKTVLRQERRTSLGQ